jgi:hypothetical protein
MAEQQVATFSNKPISAKQKEKDFEEHVNTYKGFMELAKWGVIANAVILIALYFFLVH